LFVKLRDMAYAGGKAESDPNRNNGGRLWPGKVDARQSVLPPEFYPDAISITMEQPL